jgi:acetyltransferase
MRRILIQVKMVVIVPTYSSKPKSCTNMAIEPYPSHLVSCMRLADGTDIELRPIRPQDREIEANFVRNLSPSAKYFRFMETLRELTPEMLERFTKIDYARELALIALAKVGGKEVEIAVARYVMNPDGESCEFAIVVADAWQGKGIGTRLMTLLLESARARGLRIMEGDVLAENTAMVTMVKNLGFTVEHFADDGSVCRVTRAL